MIYKTHSVAGSFFQESVPPAPYFNPHLEPEELGRVHAPANTSTNMPNTAEIDYDRICVLLCKTTPITN